MTPADSKYVIYVKEMAQEVVTVFNNLSGNYFGEIFFITI